MVDEPTDTTTAPQPDDPHPSGDSRDGIAPDEDGWVVESDSVIEPGQQPEPPERERVPAVVTAAPSETAPEAATSTSPSAAGTETDPATETGEGAAPPSGSRKRDTKTRRYNDAVRARHDAERRLALEAAKRETLEQELARTRAAPPGAPPPAAPATPDAAVPAMPVHPTYSDFDTEADYQQATSQWATDLEAWQTAREARLATAITGAVDDRLAHQQVHAQLRTQQERFGHSLRAVSEQHPDLPAAVKNLEGIRSSWAPADAPETPFIHDLVLNTRTGADYYYHLATHPEEAQVVAELFPSRHLRDAVLRSSAPDSLMRYFATDEGRDAFHRLAGLPDAGDVRQTIGELSARLEAAAARGPASTAPKPITSATPPAQPPVGSPMARGSGPRDATEIDLDDEAALARWIEADTQKDIEADRRSLGL